MKWIFFTMVAAAIVLGASVTRDPGGAFACSIGGVGSHDLPGVVADSPIIAVGTIVDSREAMAVFRVDDAIKGTSDGARIPVDNRTSFTYFDCGPPDEFNAEWDEGYRFDQGEEVLLFLHMEMGGVWHVSHFSFAAFAAPADEFVPLTARGDEPAQLQLPPPRLDEILATLEAGSIGTNRSDNAEREAGCHTATDLFEPSKVAAYASLAQAVALVTVTDAPDRISGPGDWSPATVRVDRLIGGTLDDRQLTLNQQWIGQNYGVDDCVAHVQTGGLGLVAGEQYLVFLRPDELGGADYRAVSWGEAMVQVNERYVVGRLTTLDAVRREVRTQHAGPSTGGQDVAWFVPVATAALALAAAATVVAGVRTGARR